MDSFHSYPQENFQPYALFINWFWSWQNHFLLTHDLLPRYNFVAFFLFLSKQRDYAHLVYNGRSANVFSSPSRSACLAMFKAIHLFRRQSAGPGYWFGKSVIHDKISYYNFTKQLISSYWGGTNPSLFI